MQNPATRPQDEMNTFTRYIYENPGVEVKLANGSSVRPLFYKAKDDTCTDGFYLENWSMCWNLDGTSLKNSDFHMIEIIT